MASVEADNRTKPIDNMNLQASQCLPQRTLFNLGGLLTTYTLYCSAIPTTNYITAKINCVRSPNAHYRLLAIPHRYNLAGRKVELGDEA